MEQLNLQTSNSGDQEKDGQEKWIMEGHNHTSNENKPQALQSDKALERKQWTR